MDELPIGEGPRTAWLDGKTASFPSARGVGLTGDYRDLLRSTDGWVLLEARAGGASQVTQVVVVTEAGRTGVRVEPVAHVDRGTITDVAVSSDGRQVAWTSSNASPSVGQTTTADLSTGEVLDVSRFNLGGGLGTAVARQEWRV